VIAMTECNRKDLAEILILALPSSKTPEKAAEIREHVRECPECQKELEMYESMQTLFREHRHELAGAVSDCPDTDTLVRFAMSDMTDSAIEAHVACCPCCREQVETIRAVMSEREDTATIPHEPSARELSFLRQKVSERYREPQPERPGLLQRFFSGIIAALHVPSLALGAAVAALLLVCLWPAGVPIQSYRVALSDVQWPAPTESVSKSDHWIEAVPGQVKSVALVILAGPDESLSGKDIDGLYQSLALQDVLGPGYKVISPADLKAALAGLPGSVREVSALWAQVHSKTGADYLIVAQIQGRPAAITLKATLFGRGHAAELGSITQTGLAAKTLAERIKALAADLMAQAQSDGE
jgi:anti-sigma factor RsiW